MTFTISLDAEKVNELNRAVEIHKEARDLYIHRAVFSDMRLASRVGLTRTPTQIKRDIVTRLRKEGMGYTFPTTRSKILSVAMEEYLMFKGDYHKGTYAHPDVNMSNPSTKQLFDYFHSRAFTRKRSYAPLSTTKFIVNVPAQLGKSLKEYAFVSMRNYIYTSYIQGDSPRGKAAYEQVIPTYDRLREVVDLALELPVGYRQVEDYSLFAPEED